MRTSTWILTFAVVLAWVLPASAQYSNPVRNVENPDHFPLRISTNASVPAGFVGSFGIPIGAAVPADRRFVIEYVSVECTNSGGVAPARLYLSVAEKAGGSSFAFHTYVLPTQKTEPDWGGNVLSIGTQTQRLYHDGGQAVQLGISLTGVAPGGGIPCRVELSGYTVSMP